MLGKASVMDGMQSGGDVIRLLLVENWLQMLLRRRLQSHQAPFKGTLGDPMRLAPCRDSSGIGPFRSVRSVGSLVSTNVATSA